MSGYTYTILDASDAIDGATNPIRWELEIAADLTPILTYSQDGFENVEQLFITLHSLKRLGELATAILSHDTEAVFTIADEVEPLA